MSSERQLESLITTYLDGRLTPEQEQELRRRLQTEPGARQLFLSLVDLHATLLGDKHLAGQVMGKELRAALPALTSPTTASQNQPANVIPFAKPVPPAPSWKRWAIAAAVVLLGIGGIEYFRQVQNMPVAEIIRSAGAGSKDSASGWLEGHNLRRETHTLDRGSLELRTARGVTVVIEAPAEFRFESAQRLHLLRGRLSADVPPTGKGFTVVTPSGEAVDLGTRFGVDVSGKDQAEVHVFKGEVITRANQGAKKQSLKEDQAVTFNDGVTTPRALRTAAFIRADELEQLAAGLRAGQQARWTQSLTTLRQDPALLAFLDLTRDTANGGAFREAQGRWPGTRAVEFTQPGDYLAVSFQGETEELTLATWVRLDRVPHAINSLLHTDDWGQPGQVHWMVAEDQRMRFAIYDVRCVDQSRNRYPESEHTVTAATGRWTHLATVYNAKRRAVRFYIDGQFDNEVALLTGIPAILGPARVGNWNHQERILSGRLDELVLWRRALTDAEIHNLFAAGNPYQ